MLNRRALLANGAALGSMSALGSHLPAWARSGSRGIAPTIPTVTGRNIDLRIGHSPFTVSGWTRQAITINGVLPAPLVRLQEGQMAQLSVTNTLEEDTSIHWHGIILPFQMDGVPGVSFPGIRPNETFVYKFPVKQSGTYWYHSHSGLQEQLGHYGPIIIDPATPDPVVYDREHVLVLSDWSSMNPYTIMNQLKQEAGHFNRNKLTVSGLFSNDPAQQMSLEDRARWAKMRMDPTDIADVTAAIYTYLVNGHGPNENWTGLFRPGERVRLRVINASAMTAFNFRIPGLEMTVVNADGQNVRPVNVGEFHISVAETYDVIVRPPRDRAYTIVAESVDRSGMGFATLAPRIGMVADVPPLRPRPLLSMEDMGMGGMSGMSGDSKGGSMGGGSMVGMNHGAMGGGNAMPGMKSSGSMGGSMGGGSMAGMNHGAMGGGNAKAGMKSGGSMGGDMASGGKMDMDMRNPANAPPNVEVGVGVDMVAPMPPDRTGHPGLGLTDVGHRVLTYRDLVALEANPDARRPTREIQIYLTGNMRRFMWSFDGRKFSEGVEPIRLARNERVRVTLVNSTMMQHPWWDMQAWYGGDINKLWFKSEGGGTYRGTLETAEVQVLWSRAVTPYFDFQAGVRQDFAPGSKRTHLALGVQGLMPYSYDLEATLFLSTRGELTGRVKAEYDLFITQNLIAQPRVEINWSAQSMPDIGVGSGLSSVETGLRLRYQFFIPEFAPYIGIEYERKIGSTADFARAEGQDAGILRYVAGVRAWF